LSINHSKSHPKAVYITTAIDYVNAAPHLGHAYEKIASDVLVRFYRLQGRAVYFLTGTDEHGSKVEKTATTKGMAPKAYTDLISESFKTTWAELNISYDRFIRTTDEDHYDVVKHLWEVLAAQDDIYKASYTGLYCSGCENFVTQRDLTETGECPNHLVKPEPVEEENYFFRLTRYRDAIREHIEANPGFIQPEFRKEEVLKLLADVEDISVSRSIHSVTWGIPVPGDDSQRIYVWIDALSNYLTGCGYRHDDALFADTWPADCHMIGKDILRFHAIYWPAMLMAAKLPLPKSIFAHGFITFNDSKISKSTGNIVSPASLVERFELPNTDPIRYYLMSCTTFGQDGNFTEEDFKNRVNADLANNLGNLLNRTLNMTQKYFDGQVPTPRPAAVTMSAEDQVLLAEMAQAYQALSFHTVVDKALQWVDASNKQINEGEPWNLYKNGELEALADLLYQVLETVRRVALVLSPIIPVLSQEIWQQLGYTASMAEARWDDVVNTPLPAGQTLQLRGPILPRLDSEIVGAGKKK
jgi:methionyl-tRNA synthetase